MDLLLCSTDSVEQSRVYSRSPIPNDEFDENHILSVPNQQSFNNQSKYFPKFFNPSQTEQTFPLIIGAFLMGVESGFCRCGYIPSFL